jgi:hypothetical protein
MPKSPTFSIVGSAASIPQPPRPLGAHGSDLWRRVQSQFAIEDCGGVELLTLICQLIDRAERCREIIDAEGEMIHTRTGMRSHPLIRDETQCRALAMRTIDRLGINREAIKPIGRPPGKGIGWTGE